MYGMVLVIQVVTLVFDGRFLLAYSTFRIVYNIISLSVCTQNSVSPLAVFSSSTV